MELRIVAIKLRRYGHKAWRSSSSRKERWRRLIDLTSSCVADRWPDSTSNFNFMVVGALSELDDIYYANQKSHQLDRDFLAMIRITIFDIAFDKQYGCGEVHTAVHEAVIDAVEAMPLSQPLRRAPDADDNED